MIYKWDDREKEVKPTMKVVGLKHNGKRPHTLEVSLEELADAVQTCGKGRVLDWWNRSAIKALSPLDSTIKLR